MSRPRREPWSFWCVLKCSVNWPMRSLSNAICTSGLPVSLGCVPYWSMRDFLCSLANTCLVHSCLLIVCLCDVYRVSRGVVDRKGAPGGIGAGGGTHCQPFAISAKRTGRRPVVVL